MASLLSNKIVRASMIVSSFCLLTAAKGNGCGGEVVTPEPPAECPAGQHLESTCDVIAYDAEDGIGWGDDDHGDECSMVCVDDGCPEGTYEDYVCAAIACAPDSDCVPPPCQATCVPYDECGPGMTLQPLCGGDVPTPIPGGGGCDENGDCWEEPAPAPDCPMVCAPTQCGEGERVELVCSGVDYGYGYEGDGDPDHGAPEPVEQCWGECVPADICPPGYVEETFCTMCEQEEPDCWTDCVPAQP